MFITTRKNTDVNGPQLNAVVTIFLFCVQKSVSCWQILPHVWVKKKCILRDSLCVIERKKQLIWNKICLKLNCLAYELINTYKLPGLLVRITNKESQTSQLTNCMWTSFSFCYNVIDDRPFSWPQSSCVIWLHSASPER